MQRHKRHNSGGFTIVELLIVIVVIAILAAITIVAYNGIQNRAKNTQINAAVRGYVTALKAYAVENNGTFPSGNACLGPAAFYTDNPCYIGAGTYNHSTTLNNSLAGYMNNNVPTLPSGRVSNGSNSGSGIFYYSGGNYIAFPQYGSSSCPTIAGLNEPASVNHSQWGNDMYCRWNLS